MRLVLFPLLLLAAPAVDSIELRHEAGRTVSRSFSSTSSTSRDTTETNGMARTDDYSLESDHDFTLRVTDRFAAVEHGAPTSFTRTYEEIWTTAESVLGIRGQDQVTAIRSSSDLEGAVVSFDVDEESGEIVPTSDDVGDELLEGLIVHLDLAGFLPSGEVEEQEEWTLQFEVLEELIELSHALHLEPDEEVLAYVSPSASLSEWEGEVLLTYLGSKDGEARIQIDVDATQHVDSTEAELKLPEDLPDDAIVPEVNLREMDTGYQGSGVIMWSAELGMVTSLRLELDLSVVRHTEMKMAIRGTEQQIEQTTTSYGEMVIEIAFEAVTSEDG